MEWTHDGRLLVAERTNGRLVDATEGGDFGGLSDDDDRVFAHGMEGPSSMAMLPDGRILANECWAGRIVDITDGGNAAEAEPFATNLAGPYSILYHDATDSVYTTVSPSSRRSRIIDVTGGGDEPDDHPVLVDDILVRDKFPGMTPRSAWPDNWEGHQIDCGSWAVPVENDVLYSVGPLGQMVRADITAEDSPTTHAEHLDAERLVARGLNRVGGSVYNRSDGLVYAAEPFNGSVVAVDPTGNRQYRFDPRVVEGLVLPTCVRFGPDNEQMYVCGRGEGVVYKISNFRP
ncbi:hypothetical protein C482_16098 [Natrialba chahannaoensis JCM 10990]|uniref:SMP-30/gluconolaconase/LRE-like region-containing protein n=2 Tax=Natrialba chahannaoensis TaxID=68911 RepID=M0AC62_9EURY|nr:hypothetical protein C482_16098 [Natrialba chahannaoensis JCM 10990]